MNLNINNDWFTVTETGIVFSDDFSKEQWTELGKELARNSKNLMWMIGDWLIAGSHPDRKYLPDGKLDEACLLFGIEHQTANDAKVTCSAIPQSMRRPILSYGHHRAVAGREDKVAMADRVLSKVDKGPEHSPS